MKYRFIESCKAVLPVQAVCRYLGVSRSAYYHWQKHTPGRRMREDAQLSKIIEADVHKHRQHTGVLECAIVFASWVGDTAVVVSVD